jgi:hypothetical protein
MAAKKKAKRLTLKRKSAKRVEAVPAKYGTATPHVIVSACAQALDFYKKAFGAKVTSKMEGPGGVISLAPAMLVSLGRQLLDGLHYAHELARIRNTPATRPPANNIGGSHDASAYCAPIVTPASASAIHGSVASITMLTSANAGFHVPRSIARTTNVDHAKIAIDTSAPPRPSQPCAAVSAPMLMMNVSTDSPRQPRAITGSRRLISAVIARASSGVLLTLTTRFYAIRSSRTTHPRGRRRPPHTGVLRAAISSHARVRSSSSPIMSTSHRRM